MKWQGLCHSFLNYISDWFLVICCVLCKYLFSQIDQIGVVVDKNEKREGAFICRFL